MFSVEKQISPREITGMPGHVVDPVLQERVEMDLEIPVWALVEYRLGEQVWDTIRERT